MITTLADLEPGEPYRFLPTCCTSGTQNKATIYVMPPEMVGYLADLAASSPEVISAMGIRADTTTLCSGCMDKFTGQIHGIGRRMLTRPQIWTLMGADPSDNVRMAKLEMIDDLTGESSIMLYNKSQEAQAALLND